MSDQVSITTLVENTVNVAGLRAEHGLSFLIRAGDQSVLFDTGQSDLVLQNAGAMGLSLAGLDAVVLSHGHYDHTGGVEAICRVAPRARVLAHPAALDPKFTQNQDGTSRFIGLAPSAAAQLNDKGREVNWTTRPTEVVQGVFATGEIPRTTSYEDTGGRFYLDAACTALDPLLDDQALFFDTSHGLVVVLGCAHAGVVNTLDYIRNISGGRPLWAVIGGMHLHNSGAVRMVETIKALRQMAPRKLLPAHCTGFSATSKLWASFPELCSGCPVGTTLTFRK